MVSLDCGCAQVGAMASQGWLEGANTLTGGAARCFCKCAMHLQVSLNLCATSYNQANKSTRRFRGAMGLTALVRLLMLPFFSNFRAAPPIQDEAAVVSQLSYYLLPK